MQARKGVTTLSHGAMSHNAGVISTLGYPGHHAPLTKRELHLLRDKQANIQPQSCEKLDAYRHEHELASASFDKARQDRKFESNDDDARNQLIKDKLAQLRARADQESKVQNEIVKSFNQEFSSMFETRSKAWQGDHDEFIDKLKVRTASVEEDTSGLKKSIAEEHDACLADTGAEISRIRDEETELDATFNRLVADRAREHASFRAELDDTFGNLRRRITRESQARGNQAKQTQESNREAYANLAEKIKALSYELDHTLQQLEERLQEETEERTLAQDRVVDDMLRFIQAIEDNVAERTRGVAETQKLLMDLRTMLNEG